MLTKLTVRNFKRFEEVEIELGSPVVFVGPNNSGKTTALQALTMWDTGLKRWLGRGSERQARAQRSSATANRLDFLAVPTPNARAFWRDLRVRNGAPTGDRQRDGNIRIDLIVEGETNGETWTCGLEFDYANEESLYCRPLRAANGDRSGRMEIPAAAVDVRVAYIPSISGLIALEPRLDRGAVDVRIGEGRTAEVLRNLCYRLHTEQNSAWLDLCEQIRALFGISLNAPEYVAQRGEVAMTYRERDIQLDLSVAGRGLHQTLLLLAFMHLNPNTVLLLDEPDAHLEVLRQRETYNLIGRIAEQNGNQLIVATHSEILLDEAARQSDRVVAFVGRPRSLNGHEEEVRNALAEYGYDHYLQAQTTGWTLYLEGPNDLAVLQAFATRLQHHGAEEALVRPFVHYVGNQVDKARNHFHSIRIAVPDLRGIALFDNLRRDIPGDGYIEFLQWRRNEIENYIASRETLKAYAAETAQQLSPGPLLTPAIVEEHRQAMQAAIEEVENAARVLNRAPVFSDQAKASSDALEPILSRYAAAQSLGRAMPKKSFHELVQYIPEDMIDPEITEKLDAIAAVAESVTPPGLP